MGKSPIPFSVIMSVYWKENAEHFDKSLKSVFNQTYTPDEVLLIVDGPVGDNLQAVIEKYKKYDSLSVLQLEKNGGLGNALRLAVKNSKYDLIARMDTDDIALSNRFEKQINAYMESPADVIGGRFVCFTEDPETSDLVTGNTLFSHDDIVKNIWKGNPFAHPTVLYRKQAVLDAGNYEDVYLHEDYYLWVKMLKNGCVFKNIPDYVLFFRSGIEQTIRRGGIKNFKAECKVQKYLMDNNIISKFHYLEALAIKFVYHVLVSGKLRYYLCKKYRWQNISEEERKYLIDLIYKGDTENTEN